MNILIIDFSHKKQERSETVNLYYTVASALRSYGYNIGLLLVETRKIPVGYDDTLYNLGCYMVNAASGNQACRRLGEEWASSAETVSLPELQRRLNIDLLHVCTLGVERHGNLLSRLSGPVCIDCHDCASRHRYREVKHALKFNIKRVPKTVLKLFYDLYREAMILRQSKQERIYTLVSEGDATWFQKISPKTNSRWIQPHVIPSNDRCLKREMVDPYSVGIWGCSGIWNEAALEELIAEVLPLLQQRQPRCRIKVFGKVSDQKQQQYADRPDVVFEGFVEDLRSSIQSCEICCFPFSYGSGIKTKLLECLNWGVPCVTSRVGAEGLRENQKRGLLVGGSVEEMADMCLSLLGNKEKKAGLIKLGFETIDVDFSEPNAMASYSSAYEKILNQNAVPSV